MIKSSIQRHKKIIIALSIYFIFLIWYANLPDYQEYNSYIQSSRNYRETDLKVVVYKAHYIPSLYEEIVEKHNRINGIPNKLTLELYFSEKGIEKGRNPYRTIVFDYDNHVEYVLLNYIVNKEE